PGGKVLASGWGAISLWDVISGEPLQQVAAHTDSVDSLAFAGDGSTLVSSGLRDSTVRLWNTTTGEQLRSWRGRDDVLLVDLVPDGKTVISGSADGTIRFWDAASGTELRRFTIPVPEGVNRAQATTAYLQARLTPDGTTLVARSELSQPIEQRLTVWDATTGKQRLSRVLPGDPSSAEFLPDSAEFSPDGATLAVPKAETVVRRGVPTATE